MNDKIKLTSQSNSQKFSSNKSETSNDEKEGYNARQFIENKSQESSLFEDGDAFTYEKQKQI